jgi:hypothetical protein
MKDFLVDLRYRGDFTAESRAFLEPYIRANNLAGAKKAYLANTELFKSKGCPDNRTQKRVEILTPQSNESVGGISFE